MSVQPMFVCVWTSVWVCIEEKPRLWKGYRTISKGSAPLAVSSHHQVQQRLNNGVLWAGEQINVICTAYHDRGQMLHLTDTLNTLGFHNGPKSREGQPDVLHLNLHPCNLKRISSKVFIRITSVYVDFFFLYLFLWLGYIVTDSF